MKRETGRLKRYCNPDLPDAIMMPGGQIHFRHYHITVHALDRFAQRSGMTTDKIVPCLAGAFLADKARANYQVRRFIEKTEERGGYVLMNRGIYFAVQPDPVEKSHAVKTVFSQANFRSL